MKAGWVVKALHEVCEFQRGLTYAKNDEVDISNNIVLRATNINLATNLLDFDELKYINENVAVAAHKLVKKNSLMICTASGSKSHLGKVAFIDEDYGYAFGGFMGMLTPNAELLPRYFFHRLTSSAYKDFIASLSDGSNINNLKFDDLGRFPIPVPPLPEQHRIVAILDAAFDHIATARANCEANLLNARAIFESHLQAVFTQRGEGWVTCKFDEVCVLSQGIQVDAKLQSEVKLSGDQVRFLRIVDFTQGNEPARYIDNPGSKFIVSTADISLVRYGASTGFVCSGLDGAIANNLFRVIPRKLNLSTEYLFWFLRSPLFQDEIKRKMNGAAMPAINFGMIRDIDLPIPSLPDQVKLVEVIARLELEVRSLESLYQRKLQALDDLKKSLLHQAFSGLL